jgi:hypothetical protein
MIRQCRLLLFANRSQPLMHLQTHSITQRARCRVVPHCKRCPCIAAVLVQRNSCRQLCHLPAPGDQRPRPHGRRQLLVQASRDADAHWRCRQCAGRLLCASLAAACLNGGATSGCWSRYRVAGLNAKGNPGPWSTWSAKALTVMPVTDAIVVTQNRCVRPYRRLRSCALEGTGSLRPGPSFPVVSVVVDHG